MKKKLLIAVGLALIVIITIWTSCDKSDTGNIKTLPKGVSVESKLPSGTSWASMLFNASELENLIYPPKPYESSRMFSSSADDNKEVLAHLAPEVLGDLDHGFFLSVIDTNNYVEATLLETEGSGAITWMWSANPVGEVYIYIDDKEEPVLYMPFESLLGGLFLPVKDPFSSLNSLGHNLSFPIIHKEYCKVVLRVRERKELAELFYQIAWNSLDETSEIHSFDIHEISNSEELIGSLAKRFMAPPQSFKNTIAKSTIVRLEPNSEKQFFESEESGVIRSIKISAPSAKAISDLWVKAYWDGKTYSAVSAPLSMILGVSKECEDTTSFPSSLSGTTASIHWPMPFGPKSSIALQNSGTTPLTIKVTTSIENRDSTSSLLRFNANYIKYDPLFLNQRNILSFMETYGSGRIVGCAIRVDSHSDKWWGEGDHIIWLDRPYKPAWQGTGTEDYFGFAWCTDGIFNHPFRGQTRSDRSQTGRRIASMHRYHLLDTLPFHSWAKFEMEAWGLSDGYMEYEASVIWYGNSAESKYLEDTPMLPRHLCTNSIPSCGGEDS